VNTFSIFDHFVNELFLNFLSSSSRKNDSVHRSSFGAFQADFEARRNSFHRNSLRLSFSDLQKAVTMSPGNRFKNFNFEDFVLVVKNSEVKLRLG